MKLTERVRADLTESMKARDAERTSTLRMLQAAIKNEQISLGHEPTDEEVTAVIRKGVKQRLDSIDQFTKGNRPELAAKERSEMELMKSYLPPEISDADVEAGVQEIIAATGATSKKDTGKVMKETMARFKGQVDGRKVQEIVGRLLP
jgi:uncharacterized protein YqeY